MIERTTSVIDAAHQLLAEFRERGSKPALWLIDPATLDEIKEAAGGAAYLKPSPAPHATFMGLPYKTSPRFPGLELLNREAAVEAGHMA